MIMTWAGCCLLVKSQHMACLRSHLELAYLFYQRLCRILYPPTQSTCDWEVAEAFSAPHFFIGLAGRRGGFRLGELVLFAYQRPIQRNGGQQSTDHLRQRLPMHRKWL